MALMIVNNSFSSIIINEYKYCHIFIIEVKSWTTKTSYIFCNSGGWLNLLCWKSIFFANVRQYESLEIDNGSEYQFFLIWSCIYTRVNDEYNLYLKEYKFIFLVFLRNWKVRSKMHKVTIRSKNLNFIFHSMIYNIHYMELLQFAKMCWWCAP